MAFDFLPGEGNTDTFISSLSHRLSFEWPLMSYWKNPTRGNLHYVTVVLATPPDNTVTLRIKSVELESIPLATSQPGRVEMNTYRGRRGLSSPQGSLPLSLQQWLTAGYLSSIFGEVMKANHPPASGSHPPRTLLLRQPLPVSSALILLTGFFSSISPLHGTNMPRNVMSQRTPWGLVLLFNPQLQVSPGSRSH